MSEQEPKFGKWRSFFWPIYTFELKKLLPMFFLFFFISYVYNILRTTKDAFILTAPHSGANAIPFLKVAGVVPMAILFMIIYAKLSNVLSKEKLFYVTVIPFLVFFVLFAFVLYPNKEMLHPTEFADWLQSYLPEGLNGLVANIRNWIYALLYIFSELWGSFILSLLFWGFANDITKVTEAKRFYALFGLGANLAQACASITNKIILRLDYSENMLVDHWQIKLYYIMGICTLSGIILMFIYRWITKNVLTDPVFYDQSERVHLKKDKPKMSLKDSFVFLARSPYVLCIAVLVLTYNISINLIEVTWKDQASKLFTDRAEYLDFSNTVNLILAITTIFMMIFVSSNLLRRFGWAFTAYVTPVAILVTGIGFFLFIIFKPNFEPWLITLGTTSLVVAVTFGSIQNIISKAAKYSLFDPTKEMAYIPLDQESKVKGKAAIDTVGARIGKATGSWIQLGLIGIFGSLGTVTPHIGVILLLIVLAWMWAIKKLDNTEFQPIEHPKAKGDKK